MRMDIRPRVAKFPNPAGWSEVVNTAVVIIYDQGSGSGSALFLDAGFGSTLFLEAGSGSALFLEAGSKNG
jgi:hypothetical protein